MDRSRIINVENIVSVWERQHGPINDNVAREGLVRILEDAFQQQVNASYNLGYADGESDYSSWRND